MSITTGFVGLGLSTFSDAGLSLQYLNKSGKLRVYSNWDYGNQYTKNTKIATRGTAVLFGINQFSITRSYLTGETDYNQFKAGTGMNVLGSISPQYGLMFMTYSILESIGNAWNEYMNHPNSLKQFYNNMNTAFDEWKINMGEGSAQDYGF